MEKDVKKFISETFQKRVITLLYFGSQAFGGIHSPEPDFDFLLILDSPQKNDWSLIREYLRCKKSIDLTLHYQSHLLLRGYSRFQQGAHGVFFLKYLSHAVCLEGENPFLLHAEKIEDLKEKESLLFQCEEYFFRLRDSYMREEGREWYQRFRKYLCRVMIDMLLITKEVAYYDVSRVTREIFIKDYVLNSSCFSKSTKKLAPHLIADDVNSAEMIVELYHCLYEDYLKLYQSTLSQNK